MAKLYFRYGAMNCGKTTALLQVAHNYEERGMKIILIKPLIDTKGGNKVVSRLGVERNVDLLLKNDDNVISKIKDLPNAIIVDEAQFLAPSQVDELFYLTKEFNVPVLCYGLRSDFKTKGFPGAIRLFEIADSIEELKTICRCGKKATFNMRFLNDEPIFDGDQVVIDNGKDHISYESVCGSCYLKIRKRTTKS